MSKTHSKSATEKMWGHLVNNFNQLEKNITELTGARGEEYQDTDLPLQVRLESLNTHIDQTLQPHKSLFGHDSPSVFNNHADHADNTKSNQLQNKNVEHDDDNPNLKIFVDIQK
ncbi:MAG: hypothetical protein GY821_11980 [Gammaproteobacteria bacterium]|nr:hypothetical protein [Gammaproteobacteria bacterium]